MTYNCQVDNRDALQVDEGRPSSYTYGYISVFDQAFTCIGIFPPRWVITYFKGQDAPSSSRLLHHNGRSSCTRDISALSGNNCCRHASRVRLLAVSYFFEYWYSTRCVLSGIIFTGIYVVAHLQAKIHLVTHFLLVAPVPVSIFTKDWTEIRMWGMNSAFTSIVSHCDVWLQLLCLPLGRFTVYHLQKAAKEHWY